MDLERLGPQEWKFTGTQEERELFSELLGDVACGRRAPWESEVSDIGDGQIEVVIHTITTARDAGAASARHHDDLQRLEWST